MTLVPVALLDDIPENGNRAFGVDGRSIVLCRTALGVFAVENQCSHAQSELVGGKVRGAHIFCPLHGVRFDMRDGTPSGKLTQKPICTFATQVVDGMIHVDLPDS